MNKTLILNHDEVKELLDFETVIWAVEESFKDHYNGKTQIPDRTSLTFEKHNGMIGIMPAYIESHNAAGVKIISHHNDNYKRNLPESMGLIIYNDPKTGFPLAIMDSVYITKVRTGAASAVSAKYLAKKDSKVVGIVGAGATSIYQIRALSIVRDIQMIKVYDTNPKAIDKFTKNLSDLPIEVQIVNGYKEVCQNVDILIACTTSDQPFIHSEWVNKGTHIIGVGADMPHRNELSPELFKKIDLMVFDLISQALVSGEIMAAINTGCININDLQFTLGQIVGKKIPGRVNDDQITLFKSTGMGIQDIVTAKIIYENATEKSIGKMVRITP